MQLNAQQESRSVPQCESPTLSPIAGSAIPQTEPIFRAWNSRSGLESTRARQQQEEVTENRELAGTESLRQKVEVDRPSKVSTLSHT